MIVVADTSVLINLCRIGRAELLPPLFHEIVVPPAVVAEYRDLVRRDTRFAGLELPIWLRVQSPAPNPPGLRAFPELDRGEADALALAVEIRADAILLDERRGHQVAAGLGLVVIGLLGVLLRAKAAGLLPTVAP